MWCACAERGAAAASASGSSRKWRLTRCRFAPPRDIPAIGPRPRGARAPRRQGQFGSSDRRRLAFAFGRMHTLTTEQRETFITQSAFGREMARRREWRTLARSGLVRNRSMTPAAVASPRASVGADAAGHLEAPATPGR